MHFRLPLLVTALAIQSAALPAAPIDPATVTLEQVRSHIDPANSPHPRLILSAADFAKLKQKIARNGETKALFEALKASADSLLGTEPIRYQKQGRRLLSRSRECNRRVACLAMVYRLSGEEKYLERAKRELLAPVDFPDWNPSHFLDTAEMTLGLALGYDWLYDDLDAGTRDRIRDGIIKHGLEPAISTKRRNWWIRATNNWGQVCHAGITAGALALMEDDPDRAAWHVHRAVRNVLPATAVYNPTGTYPEGPGYWIYGTTFNVLLIACLESATGSDFGLAAVPGFDRTAAFLNHATGPSGQFFNFADCGRSSHSLSYAMWWLARRFDRPDWLVFQRPRLERANQGKVGDLMGSSLLLPLLGNGDRPDAPNRMSLHWNGICHNQVTMHRTSWTDPDALFVGFKAGTPRANHGHMDIGSFVFEADGVRWAIDLGSEGYHKVESSGVSLWNSSQKGDRWSVFRLSTEAHGTLMIDEQAQRVDGVAEVVRFSENKDFPHSVIDMTEVYAGQVKHGSRGVAIHDNRQLIVRDHLEGMAADAKLRWGMVTRADVTIPSPGEATLRRDGKTLQLRVIFPADAQLTTWDMTGPRNKWDSPNKGVRMLGFIHPAGTETATDLLVTLTPGDSAVAPPDAARRPPLSWSEPLAADKDHAE